MDEFSLSAVAESLFAEPTGVVFHYTSLRSFMEMARSGEMFASDIRYQNDSVEMTHALNLVQEAKERRTNAVEQVTRAGGNVSSILDASSLSPLFLWDLYEEISAAGCYVACFTKEGNQLSQWRGYCPPHKGISIGFDADDLKTAAAEQRYVLRECVYDPERQQRIGEQLLDALKFKQNAQSKKEQSELLNLLQQIAAVLKHPRFAEEKECRLVSGTVRGTMDGDVLHREGKSMVIPYRSFKLPRDQFGRLKIARVIVGPTLNVQQAVGSVYHFLASQRAAAHLREVEYCHIPLREA